METVLFYAFAATAIVSAVLAISRKNAIASALHSRVPASPRLIAAVPARTVPPPPAAAPAGPPAKQARTTEQAARRGP